MLKAILLTLRIICQSASAKRSRRGHDPIDILEYICKNYLPPPE